MVQKIIPGFQNLLEKQCEIKLEIPIEGYTDERKLSGTYVNEFVKGNYHSPNEPLAINRNDGITNKELSALRE